MRTTGRVLSLILGLALAAFSVFVVIEATLLWRGQDALLVPRGSWDDSLRRLTWDDQNLRIVAIGLIVAGALLILLQLLPRRRVRLALRSAASRPTWISKRSVRRMVSHVARQDRDVISASTELKRRRALLSVSTARSVDDEVLRTRVADAEQAALDSLQLVHPVSVRVAVSTAKDRVR